MPAKEYDRTHPSPPGSEALLSRMRSDELINMLPRDTIMVGMSRRMRTWARNPSYDPA